MAKQFFISATGTDIGKTFVLENLVQNLLSKNHDVFAIKPVISGFDPLNTTSDLAKILGVLKKEINQNNFEAISPWRFKAPLSPNIAAALEGKKIDFDKVIEFCLAKISAARKADQYLFIEGAGGIMTPVSDDKTYLDLAKKLNIPLILVMGNYLGTISHSLTAIKAIEAEDVEIDRIILNIRKNDVLDFKQNLQTLKNFTRIKIELMGN